jgi:hypothetical protein
VPCVRRRPNGAVHTNWSRQAARAAQAYRDYSSFSRTGLIEQLVYEGYTHTRQPTAYGVTRPAF